MQTAGTFKFDPAMPIAAMKVNKPVWMALQIFAAALPFNSKCAHFLCKEALKCFMIFKDGNPIKKLKTISMNSWKEHVSIGTTLDPS